MANVFDNVHVLDTRIFQSSSAIVGAWKVYLIAAFPVIIYLLHLRATRLRVLPDGVPWIGLRNEWFPKTRANMRELSNSKTNIEEGYQRVSPMLWLFLSLAD